MPPELVPDDDDYASSEDSDFAPDAAPAQASEESSDDESEAEAQEVKAKPRSTKRKRGADDEAEDAGFENSGDEAVIEKGLKKQRKKSKKGKDAEDVDDEGGEGGLIKTRSMRAQEKVEKKPLVDTTAATVDVEALWESMISGKAPGAEAKTTTSAEASTAIDAKGSLSPDSKRNGVTSQNGRKDSRSPSTLGDGPDSMIMIKRSYNFAGKVHTEQKMVPRNSAEAKLYLSTQKEAPDPTTEDPSSPFTKSKRPVKKARRSVFEPVTEGLLQRTDLHFGVRKDSGLSLVSVEKEAKKLNTVEKSAMDWAGFVDKEGIKDDLAAAGKSKGAYKARQEFLARVEAKKEEDARKARGL